MLLFCSFILARNIRDTYTQEGRMTVGGRRPKRVTDWWLERFGRATTTTTTVFWLDVASIYLCGGDPRDNNNNNIARCRFNGHLSLGRVTVRARQRANDKKECTENIIIIYYVGTYIKKKRVQVVGFTRFEWDMKRDVVFRSPINTPAKYPSKGCTIIWGRRSWGSFLFFIFSNGDPRRYRNVNLRQVSQNSE